MKKICICWIGIGKYNCLFDDFYKSFNEKFCTDCDRTFFIFTDLPNDYISIPNTIVYNISNACTHKEFILFRKFKYLLMAEDKYLDYDIVIFANGNSYCQNKVSIDEIFEPKMITCINHPSGIILNGLMGNPFTTQHYIAKQWLYKQAGLFILESLEFLKMANLIESWRMQDKVNGVSKYVLYHDEGYFNKYCIKNKDNINEIDSLIYMCPQYFECSKNAKIITRQKEWIKCMNYTIPRMDDLYEL